MGPSRDRTRDPWNCSQTCICSQTRYRLRYAARCFPCGVLGQVWYLIYRFLNFATFLTRIHLYQQLSTMSGPLYESVHQNIFLINHRVCCGYLKETSQWNNSFQHQKHMGTDGTQFSVYNHDMCGSKRGIVVRSPLENHKLYRFLYKLANGFPL